MYISAPVKKMDKPVQELKAFAKSRLLVPGESERLVFKIKGKDLSSFYSEQSAWITDAGKYELRIGFSSRDIKQTGHFTLKKDVRVETTNKVLQPQAKIDELKAQR